MTEEEKEMESIKGTACFADGKMDKKSAEMYKHSSKRTSTRFVQMCSESMTTQVKR
jgi:hypothetical protein